MNRSFMNAVVTSWKKIESDLDHKGITMEDIRMKRSEYFLPHRTLWNLKKVADFAIENNVEDALDAIKQSKISIGAGTFERIAEYFKGSFDIQYNIII